MLALSVLFVSCGQPNAPDPATAAGNSNATPAALASGGQVAAPASASPFGISTYAASRFLEQASFGPTPQAIADVKRLGFAGWIDQQMALPVPTIDGTPLEDIDPNTQFDFTWEFLPKAFSALAISGPQQLRLRSAWAVSQFLVVSQQKVLAYGTVQYVNFLMSNAFSNYGDLLRALSIHAPMGQYLDNNQNRAESACLSCAANENYARELLQLFSIGVNKLNPDGSLARDSRGSAIETYTQSDVQNLARALTGWSFAPQAGLGKGNYANYAKPMVPVRAAEHDTGAKRILGQSLPAGQDANKDLDSALAVIYAHPNVAPFVSFRLIQNLVASDPGPDYVRRVASVFNDDGTGKRGNLAAVIKAVLLDPEARAGDSPGASIARVGRIREPYLISIARWRGLGCTAAPARPGGSGTSPALSGSQWPFNAPSVFGFYMPTDRAPGSQLLAPEQGLLDGNEMRARLGDLPFVIDTGYSAITAAGCRFDDFEQALLKSPDVFVDLVSARFFRGSLPPTLRAATITLAAKSNWMAPRQRAAALLAFLLASPSYGAIR